MNQNPLIDSTKSPQTPGLNPTLTTALASLEIQLDQELTRYRRTRKNTKSQTARSVESYTNYQTTTLSKEIQLPAVPPVAIPSENPFLTNETETIDFPQEFANSDIEETPTPPNLEKSTSSIVPTKIPSPDNQTLLTSNDPPQQPNDYLESSEALLRSLTAVAPQNQTPNSPKSRDSVLSPLGIGSMLLLLLASLTLGYVVFNPKNLPKLNFSSVLNNNSSKTAENTQNTEIIENNSQLTSEPKITPIAKYPNLATQEFRQVRDPKDVVDLTPKVKPTPQIISTPVAIQPPITPISPLPRLSPLPNTLSKSTPLAKPTATFSPLPEDVKPSANGYYYIIADNQGDKALTAAKQVVPDAYLSPNKKFIYLGALKTKDEIKRRLQELEAKGIKGRLQQP
ncbi:MULTISPECIES: hypothetical protein [Aphanizomenonaceae]|uniref:hypothetical protein n=1 Tax=Aphanizomenonaceae TaxID=1892259 RepID=UPI00048A1463|nr:MULTISPECIES: hypothetical protein [Aphanizomenonaceae]MBE9258971.1 hypothetical protein [Dolichospermum sp. LEGE 00246]MDK2409719.1 hypothetical protein [Aphanizomenon sp. 202]MDK2460760.1 hypothetical protein [Aphanizomenon sp. PH219]